MVDLEKRLLDRAAKIRGYIASSQIVVDLLQPQMALFDAREGGHDTYTVRLAVDHKSSIRTQTKEAEELEQAADTIATLRAEVANYAKTMAAIDAAANKEAAELVALRAEVERMREALGPFADVAEWAERNGHDLLNDFDMLLRHLPGGQFAGHLQVQGPAFIAARAALGGADE